CCTSRPKMDTAEEDICRVCRSEGTQDRPLYHPCVCTGSIKFIHQECLLQWLKHSRKEYCELCQHRFAFTPIYSPDMPSRLPVQDIFTGLLTSVGTAVRYWFHYTLVAFSWLGLVPLTACRIYKCLFAGSVSSLLTLPLDLLSTQNLLADCLQGCFVVACTLGAFISLVWLREQIVHGGAPQWLEQNPPPLVPHGPAPADQAPAVGPPDRPPDHLAPADPPEAENLGDEADLDDDDDGEEEGEEEEEVRVQDGNNGEDLNWNALEWERAAEELTWERMLGLDGSLVFLEHVFWVVSLNALFILVFGKWDAKGLSQDSVVLQSCGSSRWSSDNELLSFSAAFCPYHIGHFWVAGLGLGDSVSAQPCIPAEALALHELAALVPLQMKASHFEGLITTILGYVLLAGALILCHILTVPSQALASLVSFQRSRHLLGVCYIVVKVSLLVVMEIGLFPLICGWWLDICSLEMFDATLKDRQQSLASSPGTTMFLHWLVGMVYVFYLASFILLLREVGQGLQPGWRLLGSTALQQVLSLCSQVLRPGVLWFLRNLNDPDFNPVQEMIHLAVYRHLRRFILSVVVFGSIVLLMLWLPIRAIKVLFPTFLPYNVMLYSDAPVSELSLELLLLQVVLPALLEQGHTRQWLKKLVHAWTFTAGYVLDLHSYLLGEHEDHHNQINNNLAGRHNNRFPGVGEGLHAAHQALLRQAGPVGVRPYHRPVHFPLKIALLLTFMCVSLLLASLLCLTLPGRSDLLLMDALPSSPSPAPLTSVCAGRWLMSLWMGPVLVHELYTAASGLYVCWLAIRAATVVLSWMPQGPSAIMLKVHEWMLTVPLDQTPLFSPWQDWALGVLHAKIIAAITLMGPQWWLKAVIEQVGLHLTQSCWPGPGPDPALTAHTGSGCRFMLTVSGTWTSVSSCRAWLLQWSASCCWPSASPTPSPRASRRCWVREGTTAGLRLHLHPRPHRDLLSSFPGVQPEMQTLVERRIYPFLLMLLTLLVVLTFQIRQFRRLYEHIKNDKCSGLGLQAGTDAPIMSITTEDGKEHQLSENGDEDDQDSECTWRYWEDEDDIYQEFEELDFEVLADETGLIVACYHGYVDVVMALSQCPYLDVNWQDNEGNTALITAAQAGHMLISSYLLSYFPGLDLERRNCHGFTALMKAAVQGRAGCVRALMLAGGNIQARDHGRSLTPREWALFTGRQETAALMQQLMARPCAEQFCDSFSLEWPMLEELVSQAQEPRTCWRRMLGLCACCPYTFYMSNKVKPVDDGVLDHMVRVTTSICGPLVATACRTVCPSSPPCLGKRRPAVQEILRRQRLAELKQGGPERLSNYKRFFQNSRVLLIPKTQERRASLQPQLLRSMVAVSSVAARRASLLPLSMLRRSSVRPGLVVPRVRLCKAPTPTYVPEKVRRSPNKNQLQVPKWNYKMKRVERAQEEERRRLMPLMKRR
ncbi:unnamed protein product, partial [Tetraodon nigroviridis]